MTKRSDDPLNLEKVELDGRFAAEKRHQHADFAFFWVDVVDRVNLLLHGAALTVFDLDLFLSGNDHLKDLVLDAHGLDAVLEVGLDLVLVARVRVNHVPLAVLVGSAVAAVRHAHLIDHSEAPALADPEQQTEQLLENVVDTAQKQTHGDRKGNDDGSQVDRLALGRPGHLTQLRTDVADEIEWITPAASTASAGER